MKIKIGLLLFLLVLINNANAQNKYDYNWVFGKSKKLNEIVYGEILHFHNHKRTIDTLQIGDTMHRSNVSISSKEGELLFYSNGCRIIDSTHNIMEGGDSINYGMTWERFCTKKYEGYPHSQNTIILPDPGNIVGEKEGYYYIHKRAELVYDPLDVVEPDLYYTYIDMKGNNGKGKVIIKNKSFLKTKDIAIGYVTACRHSNGRDWWLIQMELDTNIYFKILITKDTIMVTDSVSMGPKFTSSGTDVGQAVFTPDGSKWIMYNAFDKAIIYDFDRETGDMSNMQRVNPQDSGLFVGVAVSPNSRFAYLSAKYDLYQIDLWEDDIQSSLVHIAHIDGFRDPTWPSTFSLAQLAPDCKIYIVNGGTNNYLHVINKPNLKGKACDFRQHSFYLPKRNYNGSLPNFPHFRIDEDQICDSTITWIPEEYIVKEINILSVYPNPASDKATISLYSEGFSKGKIEILDINGKLLKRMDIDSEEVKTIDVKNYIPGVYFVNYVSSDGVRRVEKLVVN